MTTNDPYNPSFEPQFSVRSDLWPTMNIAELTNQLDLVITKMGAVSSMMGNNPNPTYRHMFGALQTALDDLNKLIEYRTTHKETNG